MKSLSLILLFFLYVNVSVAQQKNAAPDYKLQQLTAISPSSPSFVGFRNQAQQLEGTPYLLDEWQTARIQLKGVPTYTKEIEILLDLVDHQLFVGFDEQTVGSLPTDKVDQLAISRNEEELVFKVINLKKEYGDGEDQLRYYRVLHDGKYKLWQEYSKEFKKGENVQTIANYDPSNKFVQSETYWLLAPNMKTVQRVKLSQKSLEKALPTQANRIKTLVKKTTLTYDKKQMRCNY